MKNYELDDLRNAIDALMERVACGGETVSVQVTDNHKAILANEEERNMLRDISAMLMGGTRIK